MSQLVCGFIHPFIQQSFNLRPTCKKHISDDIEVFHAEVVSPRGLSQLLIERSASKVVQGLYAIHLAEKCSKERLLKVSVETELTNKGVN